MTETKLNVKGMTCGSCVRHVRDALGDLEGVCEVDVHLREGQVIVTHEGTALSTLVEALDDAGYEAREAS